MAITIATPTEEQWPELFRSDARAFGYDPQPGESEMRRPIVDLDRFRVALDRGRIVGVAGSFGLDLTLPGGTTIPMAGLTWVSVAATHRRQGLLTRLIATCHADADERGEPVAGLFASEGGIYERFGYGVASHMRAASIERSSATFRADLPVDRGAVRYVEGDEARTHRERLWEPFRRLRPGEVSRSAVWHAFLDDLWSKPDDGLGSASFLAHDEGYAVYRVGEKWTARGPAYRLEVRELVALSPRAHLDLWRTVLGVDLVGTVTDRSLAVDDALPYHFTDPRAVQTTSLRDGLWLKVTDVAVSFGARAYGTADRLVIECEGRRWAIESDGTESSCRPVRTRPDLVVDRPSLGPLLLGGVRPSQLVAAGRITARSADVVRRADACFVTGPAPNCLTFF